MIRRVTILYEDELNGTGLVKDFGFHQLVIQCLCDRLGRPCWELEKRLNAIPAKSNGKLRHQCQENLGKHAKAGPVFAVYDADKVHRVITDLPHGACKAQFTARLKEGCEPADQLGVVLLDRNLETVIEAVLRLRPNIVPEETKARALKKKLNGRDVVLKTAAGESVEMRDLRERLLAELPSLRRLVDKLEPAVCALL